MNENDDLIRRLQDLGRAPVDPHLTAGHLTAMTSVSPRRLIAHKLRVAGAFSLGLLLGATGLASAGALPDPMQEVAHHTLGAVGVDVPRPERYHGPECGAEPAVNHGQYVKSQPKENRAQAARSRCGMPVQARMGDDRDAPGGAGGPAGRSACQGPPPWAGKGNTLRADKAAREAAQATRKAACGDDEAGEVGGGPAGKAADPAAPSAPAAPGAGDPPAADGPPAGTPAGDEPTADTGAEGSSGDGETTTTTAAEETTTTTASSGDGDDDDTTTTTGTGVPEVDPPIIDTPEPGTGS